MDKAGYNAGVAKGQTEEKTKNMMEKAGDGLQSAKQTVMNAGQQVQSSAVGAYEGMKNATGMNKSEPEKAADTVQAKAGGAFEGAKSAVGMNKSEPEKAADTVQTKAAGAFEGMKNAVGMNK